jgi:peptidoglycan/LPS O-acetylase OafA/YrhL
MARAQSTAIGVVTPAAGPAASAGRLPHLDMLRGLAALAVCAGHLRAFLFVDYGASPGGAVTKAFYLLTSRHHQAVMVFFVLSGFLVGGSVLRARARGTWSWTHYLVQRLGRLWIVIVPALLLTWVWDRLGQGFDPAAYRGSLWSILSSGAPPGKAEDLSALGFVGNLFFLQTIAVPTFGSNGPLWSLANEFWYYLLFPLAIQALRIGSTMGRIASGVLALALLVLLPFGITLAFLIWLFGVVAYFAADSGRLRPGLIRVIGLAGIAGLGAALLASTRWPGWSSDFAVGLACACMLPWLSTARVPGQLYTHLGRGLSEISYTLYLVHFPLLMFLFVAFVSPHQYALSVRSFALFLACMAITLAYAAALWFLFERNTDRWRRLVESRLRHGASKRRALEEAT